MLTARQMGKSSSMVRAAMRLKEVGIDSLILDLTAIGQNLNIEQWYDGLLVKIGQTMHLEDELEDYWMDHPRMSPVQRWFQAVRNVILPRIDKKLVVFFDELDMVRSLPFPTDELFGAIRQCYNQRIEDPEYHKLTFCLLGVATPADLIKDPNATPFNIGHRVPLNDFSHEEALPLAKGLEEHQGIIKRRKGYLNKSTTGLTVTLTLLRDSAVLSSIKTVKQLRKRKNRKPGSIGFAERYSYPAELAKKMITFCM